MGETLRSPAKSSWTRFLPKIFPNLPKTCPRSCPRCQDYGRPISGQDLGQDLTQDMARSQPPGKILASCRTLPKNFLLGRLAGTCMCALVKDKLAESFQPLQLGVACHAGGAESFQPLQLGVACRAGGGWVLPTPAAGCGLLCKGREGNPCSQGMH